MAPGHPPSGDYRLVLYQSGDSAEASLFPVDAGAFTPADYTFRLLRGQELPMLAPGEIVRLGREPSDGSETIIRAGDVVIHLTKPRQRRSGMGGGRIFAERGSVLAHPVAIGWDTSWRHAVSTSTSSVVEWELRLRRDVRSGWRATAVLVAFVALILLPLALGDGVAVFPFFYVGGGGSMVATLRAWRRARVSQRALEAAREAVARPSRPMRMSLTWTVGPGPGPRAVATLYPRRGSLVPVAEVAVMNVPVGFSPRGEVDVEVLGDPTDAPVIRAGEVELWPASRSQLLAPDGGPTVR